MTGLVKTDRRTILGLGLAAGAAGTLAGTGASATSAAAPPTAGTPPKTGFSPAQALARLVEGNRRFVADQDNSSDLSTRRFVADQDNSSDLSTRRRLELARGQGPFARWSAARTAESGQSICSAPGLANCSSSARPAICRRCRPRLARLCGGGAWRAVDRGARP